MPKTKEQRNAYKRNKRKSERDRIDFLEANDPSNPEIVAYYDARSNRNEIDRKRRKDWPSQDKTVRNKSAKLKLNRIKELERINPDNPEVIQYRTIQNRRSAEWRDRNPEKAAIVVRKSKDKHREKNNLLARERRALNPEISRAKQKAWQSKNLDKVAGYRRKWINTHPQAKVANILRVRLNSVLNGKIKAASALDLLGCSLDYFMKFIERKFKSGMSWANYSLKTWHIDHRLPCSSFNMNDEWEQRWCFHYSNLQPMFAKENIAKSNKLPQSTRESCEAQPQFA